MHKHPLENFRPILAALLVLMVLLTGTAAEGSSSSIPDDASLLELMFPGAPFEVLPNFFYTNEPIYDGYYQYNQYGNRTIYQVKETKRVGDQVMVVALILGSTHVEGYMNHAFAVYDLGTQALVGEILYFHADMQDYLLIYKDGVAGFLCVGTTTYQGVEAYDGGRYEWHADHWVRVWLNVQSEEEYAKYWQDRKAIIYHDAQYGPGVVGIYTRNFTKDTEAWAYTWEHEDSMSF